MAGVSDALGACLALCQTVIRQAEAARGVMEDAFELAQRAQGIHSLLESVQCSDESELHDSKAARNALKALEQRLQSASDLVQKVQRLGRGGVLLRGSKLKEKLERIRSGLDGALSELQVAVLGDTQHLRGNVEQVQASLRSWHVQQAESDKPVKEVVHSCGDTIMDHLQTVKDLVTAQLQREVGEKMPFEESLHAMRQELEELRTADDQAEEKHLKVVIEALNQQQQEENSNTSKHKNPEKVKPSVIPREEFHLGAVIGEGAFGHVLKGSWRGRNVVLKQCNGVKDTELDSLSREAEILARVKHPHLVCLHGVVHDDAGFGLVLDYADGGDIRGAFGRTEMHWQKRGLRLAKQVAHALEYLHLQQPPVVHRDVKPENVLVDQHLAIAKVSDVGTAKALEKTKLSTMNAGTPLYMAPELTAVSDDDEHEDEDDSDLEETDDKNYDTSQQRMITEREGAGTRADVFSLGVLLHTLVKGKEPQMGRRGKVKCNVEALKALIRRCCAQKPRKRLSMATLLRRLEMIMAEGCDPQYDDSVYINPKIASSAVAQRSEEGVPHRFLCPISMEPMVDPVFLVDTGNTFNRDSIETHLQHHPPSDPLTREVLQSTTLRPNRHLRSDIYEWFHSRGIPFGLSHTEVQTRERRDREETKLNPKPNGASRRGFHDDGPYDGESPRAVEALPSLTQSTGGMTCADVYEWCDGLNSKIAANVIKNTLRRAKRRVDLSDRRLGDNDTFIITKILRAVQIDSLELRGNKIGDEGAKDIRESLKTNTALHSLNLVGNNIGAEGGKGIAEALKTNTALQSLDLTWNSIGADGGKAIAEALRTNTTLQSLDLRGNEIGAQWSKAIREGLKANNALQRLNLRGNGIGPEGGKAIAEALKTNTALQYLNLFHNKIGDEGAKAIGEALKTNATLQSLNLVDNNIGVEGGKAIIEGNRAVDIDV